MNVRFTALLRPLAILAGAGVIVALMLSMRQPLSPRNVDKPLPLVSAQTIEKSTLPITIVAHGNVTAWRQLELTAEVSGRIVWTADRFRSGMVVDEGEALLRIDSTDYELALAEARQSLASAELALADARALGQKARVNEAEATAVAARARITRAQRDLDNTSIRAPYNAVIDSALVELGQYINTGTEVGRILGSDKAEIRLPILPQDIPTLDEASTVTILPGSRSGMQETRWSATVARVEARVDSETRVIPVVVEVPDPLDTEKHEAALPFGLFVRAEIAGKPVADAVRIPQSALHGESDVFVFEEGRLRRRTVEVARRREGQALITGGLNDGDRVVTTRLDLMFEGLEVDIVDE